MRHPENQQKGAPMCTSRSLSPTAAMRSATQIRKSFAGLPSRTSSAGSREHFVRAMKSAQRAQSGSSAGMDREGLQRKCLTMIANKVEKISGAKSPASRKNLAELMLPRRGAEGRHFNFCINQKRLSFRPRIFADFGKIGNFQPLRKQSHQLFAVADFKLDKVDVELGIGHGFTPGSDGLVVKAIIGYAFPVPGKSDDAPDAGGEPDGGRSRQRPLREALKLTIRFSLTLAQIRPRSSASSALARELLA